MNKLIYLLILLIFGFSFAQERFVSDKGGVASCSTYIIVDAEGVEIELPPNVAEALYCRYPSLSPDGEYMAYFQDDAIYIYDFAQESSSHSTDIATHHDGISSEVFWSEDLKRLGLVQISQSGIFKHNSQVRIFDLDGISIVKELLLDIEVTFTCPSGCFPLDIDFEGNDVLRYQTNSSIFYMQDLKTIARLELGSP